MTDVIDAILNRASQPRLALPAPDQATLDTVFECAARAPDHALLRPWRYLVIEGQGLAALGEVFARTVDDPDNPLAGDKEKLRRSPLRAPMIIVGITCYKTHPKVPAIEQTMSSAVGLGYVSLALQSAGYGVMWRTGALAYHPLVHRALGLTEDEAIAGFLYVGTAESEKPSVPRPSVAEFVQRWPA
ncbi:nitroreductase family protein [Marinobacter caseinilyticus]|uniref:nitroreductase family protein n=1 Tax=Marinobacter caseinilyticus TaxID=2692195 RepID=UPI001409A23C|nr:nitroreductase [Marinobacter caseinilyticus]